MKTVNGPMVEAAGDDLVCYRELKALNGFVKWKVEVSRERISTDVHIVSQGEVNNIYVNGKLWKESNDQEHR